jgi:hypothetical protein
MPEVPKPMPMSETHIDISSDAEIAAWCARLDVRPVDLYSAVRAVGGSARFVTLYLEQNRRA